MSETRMNSAFPTVPHRQSTPVLSLALQVRIIRHSVIAVWFFAAGCAVPQNTFVIVDHRTTGTNQRYRETFDEAYYDIDARGSLDLVLRRAGGEGGSDGRTVEQVIHVATVWRSIPGETVAHESQINGTISYYMISGRNGASFEGAGSVFFKENRDKIRLSGSIDLAMLRPGPKFGEAAGLFERAELRGTFHAVRDPRRTIRLVHDAQRRFEPIAGR